MSTRTEQRLLLYLIGTLLLYILLYWNQTLRTWLWFGDYVDMYPIARWMRQLAFAINQNWQSDSLRYASYFIFLGIGLLYVVAIYSIEKFSVEKQVHEERVFLKWVVIPYICFGLTSLVLFPHFSRPTDTADYAMQARIQFVYAENPYQVPGVTYAESDPLVQFMEARTRPSVYGPAWQFLSILPTFLGQGRPIQTLVVFKVFFFLCGLVALWLIWIYHQRAKPPTDKVSYLLVSGVMLAWNPILHWKSHGSGHNDIVMALFMLASLVLFARTRLIGGYALWGVATLTKFITAPLLMPMMVATIRLTDDRRRGFLTILAGLALVGGLGLLLILPFGLDALVVTIFGRYGELASSEGLSKAGLLSRFYQTLANFVNVAIPETLLSLLVSVSLPGFWLFYTAVRSLSVASVNKLVQVSLESVLVWLTFVAMPLHAQYAVLPVVLGSLLREGIWHRVAVILFSLAIAWDFVLLVYPPSPMPLWERGLHQLSHMVVLLVMLVFCLNKLSRRIERFLKRRSFHGTKSTELL